MTNLALLAATLIAGQTNPPAQLPGKLLGRDLKVSFPTIKVPESGFAHLDWNGWKFEVKPDGTLGRRYLNEGGWEDYRSSYAKALETKEKRPLRIKIVVVQFATILETSTLGIVRQRRGSLDSPEIDTIVDSLGTLKGMIEAASNGRLDVKFDATLDSDPVVGTETTSESTAGVGTGLLNVGSSSLSSDPFASKYIAEEIAPQFNDEKFETDDGVYHGPFDSVIVIHAGLCRAHSAMVDNTPVTTLPYFVGRMTAKQELPVRLFETWIGQLGLKASKGLGSAYVRSTSVSQFPSFPGGPYFEELVDDAVFGKKNQALPWVSLQDGQPHVSFETADVVISKLKGTGRKAVAWAMSPTGPEIVLDKASYTQDDVSEASKVTDVAPAKKSLNDPGTAVGDYECKMVTPGTYAVTQRGSVARGYVTLLSGERLVEAGAQKYLGATVKLSSDENIAFGLYSNERRVGTVLLGGDTPGPGERAGDTSVLDRSVPADDQPHKISVPLGGFTKTPITEIRLEAPYSGRYERLTRGPAEITVSELVVMDSASQAEPLPNQVNLPAELAKIASDLTADQKAMILNGLKSPTSTTRLTALSVLGRIKFPDAIPQLSELSQSLYLPYSLLAIRALAAQDTPDSWIQIRQCVEKGPFDHCRRFAAIEIASHPDPAMASSLNFMATRSWHARYEAAKALGQLKTTSSAIILAAMMNSEPEPTVRLAIARVADVKVELTAKRVLYAAVNDSSQWVRAASYGSLIDATDRQTQAEALKGVRDDSISVRLYILSLMKQRANESYRPALWIAVTDSNADVRVAALEAFAKQPGAVDPNEVKNTFTDADPRVKKALQDLATAKGFKVPA